jgi:hypothetical protein
MVCTPRASERHEAENLAHQITSRRLEDTNLGQQAHTYGPRRVCTPPTSECCKAENLAHTKGYLEATNLECWIPLHNVHTSAHLVHT